MKKKNRKNKIIRNISIVIIIVLVIFCGYLFIKIDKFEEPTKYEQKMNEYALNEIYENNSARYNQSIKKIEALKGVIFATTNSNVLYNDTNKEFTNEDYISYANEKGYITNHFITLENCEKRATYLDVIKLISNAKYYVLEKDYSEEVKANYSNFEKLEKQVKKEVTDLVSCEILVNTNSKLNVNKKIKKGHFNEMLVKYIEKFNLLTNGVDNVEKDEEKMPSNKEEYPYISKDVEKEVYEQPYVQNQSDTACNSLEYYQSKKAYFDVTAKTCEDYYNTILNVDYKTIDYETLKSKLQDLVVGSVKEEVLKTYVEYVKNNKIVIKGQATVQMPCIYYDGLENIVRTKLEFEVVESNTNENLLYMDLVEDSKKIYNTSNLIYIDARMGYVLDTENTYIYQNPVYTMLLDMSKDKVEVK